MARLAALFLALFLADCVEAQTTDTKANSQSFAWREFKTAFAEAQKSEKMIFVDIYTDW